MRRCCPLPWRFEQSSAGQIAPDQQISGCFASHANDMSCCYLRSLASRPAGNGAIIRCGSAECREGPRHGCATSASAVNARVYAVRARMASRLCQWFALAAALGRIHRCPRFRPSRCVRAAGSIVDGLSPQRNHGIVAREAHISGSDGARIILKWPVSDRSPASDQLAESSTVPCRSLMPTLACMVDIAYFFRHVVFSCAILCSRRGRR